MSSAKVFNAVCAIDARGRMVCLKRNNDTMKYLIVIDGCGQGKPWAASPNEAHNRFARTLADTFHERESRINSLYNVLRSARSVARDIRELDND